MCLSHSLLLGGTELKSQGKVARGQEKPGRSQRAWGEGTVTENGTNSPGSQPTTRKAAGGPAPERWKTREQRLKAKANCSHGYWFSLPEHY